MLTEMERFDLNSIDAAFIENPHPTLHWLRNHSPIHRNADGSVYLTRHADVQKVYQSRDMLSDKQEEFGKKFGRCPLHTHHTTSLIFNDPPYHTVVRKLISGAFTPRKLAIFEPLIDDIVDRLLDHVEDLGELDLIDDFAKTLPTEIISFMLGIPEDYRSRLRGYSLAILGALDPVVPQDRLVEGNKAVEEFGEILNDLINHRRNNPDGAHEGEVLEALIFGEHDGRRLTQEELVQNCIFLLNAGHEATVHSLGNTQKLLLETGYRGDWSAAVEEGLRMDPPLHLFTRWVYAPVEVAGHVLHTGQQVALMLGAAGRDPTAWPEPHRFDPARFTRRTSPQTAFGAGRHFCLGAPLARLEMETALEVLFARFPRVALAEAPRYADIYHFHGLERLRVTL